LFASRFWYEQQTIPTGDWTRHFEIQLFGSLAALRAALPQDLSQVALLGAPAPEMAAWGLGCENPEKLLLALDFTRAVKTRYELSSCARRTAWPPGPRRGRRGLCGRRE